MKALLSASVVLVACAASAPPVVAPEPPVATVATAPKVETPLAPPAPAKPPAPAAPMTPGIVLIGEVIAPPKFDPKQSLENLKPDLLRCYNETRSLVPALRGKLVIDIKVNEAGAVTGAAAEPGGTANDPGLVGCIADAVKPAMFPKPGGMATIRVPLIFKP